MSQTQPTEPVIWLKREVPGVKRTTVPTLTAVETEPSTECPNCHALITNTALILNQYVCPECDHHLTMTARQRLEWFLSSVETELGQEFITGNPLNFAVRVMGGSMGSVVGDRFVQAAEKALTENKPLVCFAASGGARMQEGLLSLMQMARTSAAIERLRLAGVPYVVILTNPVYGGVTASLAMLGDVHIAEPKAMIGFAGKRVIEQTVREVLGEPFQRAEFLLEKGTVDMVVHRHELINTTHRILAKLTKSAV